MWRHFFAILVVALIIWRIAVLARGTEEIKPLAHSGPHVAHTDQWSNALSYAPLVCGEAAAIFFLVDAIRRKYRGSRAVALAFAGLGIITFGVGSLLYYAFWGHRPLEPAADVFGDKFCEQCLAATTEKPAPSARAINLVLGTRYMGSSDRCPNCRSVVRTLWIWFLVPLIPAGSYRIITLQTYRFIGRRMPLRMSHVVSVYGIALAVIACFALIYFAS